MYGREDLEISFISQMLNLESFFNTDGRVDQGHKIMLRLDDLDKYLGGLKPSGIAIFDKYVKYLKINISFLKGRLIDDLYLNKSEIKLFVEDPLKTTWMLRNGNFAKQAATEYFDNYNEIEKEEEKYLKDNSGKHNAYRHIVWTALSARFGFVSFAKRWTDAHENVVQLTNLDPAMDLHNNLLGLKLGLNSQCQSVGAIINKAHTIIKLGKAKMIMECHDSFFLVDTKHNLFNDERCM